MQSHTFHVLLEEETPIERNHGLVHADVAAKVRCSSANIFPGLRPAVAGLFREGQCCGSCLVSSQPLYCHSDENTGISC